MTASTPTAGSAAESPSATWSTACEPLWSRQAEHPFVVGLGRGDLDAEKFRFYIVQDYLFLGVLSRVFAYGAARCESRAESRRFLDLAKSTLDVEAALHESYGRAFGVSATEMDRARMAPTNLAYTRFLLSTAQIGSPVEIATAVLPCAWIYRDVGRRLLERFDPEAEHPYGKWIETYADPEFAEVTDWLRAFADRGARERSEDGRTRLADLFRTAVRYEWLFWEMAWTQERWPDEVSV